MSENKVFWQGRTYDLRSLENLQKFGSIPPERQRELSRLGGIASGRKRRENAEFKRKVMKYLEIEFMREAIIKGIGKEFIEFMDEKEKKEQKREMARQRAEQKRKIRMEEMKNVREPSKGTGNGF